MFKRYLNCPIRDSSHRDDSGALKRYFVRRSALVYIKHLFEFFVTATQSLAATETVADRCSACLRTSDHNFELIVI